MDCKVSTEFDGQRRQLFKLSCDNCGGEVWKPKSRIGQHVYCSVGCSVKARNKVNFLGCVQLKCAKCKKKFYRKRSKLRVARHGIFFCSRKCKDEGQRLGGIKEIQPPHYGQNNSTATYRERGLRAHGSVCKDCGYRECEAMLDVHHIDGDRSHNQDNNLVVLCVWCHAFRTRSKWGVGIVWHPWSGKKSVWGHRLIGRTSALQAENAGSSPAASTND